MSKTQATIFGRIENRDFADPSFLQVRPLFQGERKSISLPPGRVFEVGDDPGDVQLAKTPLIASNAEIEIRLQK